jgi:hypothetical protein
MTSRARNPLPNPGLAQCDRVAGEEEAGHNLFGVSPTGMQVVCAQCHAVVVVEDVASASPAVDAACARCGAAIDLQAAAPERGETAWLIQTADGRAGPYSAPDMARMFDRGGAGWDSLVWRAGLKDWRAARRDPQLVTALASVRGGGESWDTQRVAGHTSLLSEISAELELEPEPPEPVLASAAVPIVAAQPAAPREQAQAFRRLEPGLAEPTFADVLRSAPSILATLPTLEPVHGRALGRAAARRQSWLPSTQSMLLVAILAFVSGVLAAALWGRILEPQPGRASTIVVAPAPFARELARGPASSAAGALVSAPKVATADSEAATTEGEAAAADGVGATTLREQPGPGELAREFKRISPDVRRCVGTPARAVDVEVFFDGASGQVAGVNLHTSRLTPGEVECTTQALRQMGVAPFRNAEHKLWHRFAF